VDIQPEIRYPLQIRPWQYVFRSRKASSPEGRAQGQFFWTAHVPTAILIDGGLFFKRVGWKFPNLDPHRPDDIALAVTTLANYHLAFRIGPKALFDSLPQSKLPPIETSELYRIFFYDCPPLSKKMHLPVSKTAVDLSKTATAVFRLAAHEQLRQARKVALRLGRLNDKVGWRLTDEAQTRLLHGQTGFDASDTDFELDVVQKGVDMRLGMDVASLAYKKQVNQIVLVAADADFVPAVKLARREGIDIVIDPMGAKPAADLIEHSDGVRDFRINDRPNEKQS
jgi:uncharacterized LabA/DUF88 family protein